MDYRGRFNLLFLPLGESRFRILASTSVWEHVAEPKMTAVLAKCRQLCQSGGLVSHETDYKDYYAHRDASITPFHFLHFSDSPEINSLCLDPIPIVCVAVIIGTFLEPMALKSSPATT